MHIFQDSFYSDLNNHYPANPNSHQAGYGEIGSVCKQLTKVSSSYTSKLRYPIRRLAIFSKNHVKVILLQVVLFRVCCSAGQVFPLSTVG